MAGIAPIRLLKVGRALFAPTVAAKPIETETICKVVRLELPRSIRAFAAGSLANGVYLVRNGQLSRVQAQQATP